MITELSEKRIYDLLAPCFQRMDRNDALDALYELVEQKRLMPWQVKGIIDIWAQEHARRSKERAEKAKEQTIITDIETT